MSRINKSKNYSNFLKCELFKILEVRVIQILKSANYSKLFIVRIIQILKGASYSKFEKCALFKFQVP